MNHAGRRLEVFAGNVWSRTCENYYHFTPAEKEVLRDGGIVEKWQRQFRMMVKTKKPH